MLVIRLLDILALFGLSIRPIGPPGNRDIVITLNWPRIRRHRPRPR